MNYNNIISGEFIARPNRFIAHVNINGKEEIAHVKNTGRCKELLIPGVNVYLEPNDNPKRKTKFSLIAVEKGDMLINIDSQAPNKILEEALLKTVAVKGFPLTIDEIKREYTYGDSRLDFCLKSGDKTSLVEVKGVSLEIDGAVFFPDAPTQRGIKHINELIKAKQQGLGAIICFIIQLKKADYFSPNHITHPAFGEALVSAKEAGVKILAFSCKVKPNEITLGEAVEVRL